MKVKGKIAVFAAAATAALLLAAWYTAASIFECASVEDRQRRIGLLKKGAVILHERQVEDHIVSAVKYEGEKCGLVVFAPLENGKHKLQSAYWRDENNIVTAFAITASEKSYNVFSLIRDDLDYAEVKYSYPDGTAREFTLDMEPGQMIACCREPDASSYSIEVAFYDVNGGKYE